MGHSRFLTLALLVMGTSVLPAAVVINEIHYNGEPNNAVNEFVELHNAGDAAMDISGWSFSDGIEFVFPPGTSIPGGGFLVVAERPASVQAEFGISALGPYVGQLSGQGERVALSDDQGLIIDEVTFDIQFPWPVAADGSGASMELINPGLDNDLAGSWRASLVVTGSEDPMIIFLAAADPAWRYRPGTSEASSPMDAWRALNFVEDGTWLTGRTPIGYGDGDDNTVLTMQNNYSTVYLRHPFTVNPGEIPSKLVLRIYADDGAVVWINGMEAGRVFAPQGDLAFNALGINHEAAWEEVLINNPASLLVEGQNIIAVHALNTTLGSSDFSIDAELRTPAPGAATAEPTPGETNSVYALNAPPQTRQVDHSPNQPLAGAPAVVTTKVTDPDGVASVMLEYQVVAPGAYVPAFLAKTTSILLSSPNSPLTPNPAYHDPANWTTLAMLDDGTGVDATAGDGTYTVELPGQVNRALVRYRITVEDNLGASVRVPYPGDDSLNFAYFVYNGVPDYVADTRSVLGTPHTYPSEVIQSIPVYHVLVDAADFSQAVAYNGGDQISRDNYDARRAYNWTGTFVYEGKAYDNIGYRLRQRNARYALSGKRSFKFRFNRGLHPHFRDMDGEKYARPWRTLSTHKMVSSRNQFRTWGLYQAANHLLWNMTGTPASYTHWFHMRVVKGAEEAPAGANGQYLGDFHGMLLAMEEFDVDFLESHNLEKGNLYKLISGLTDGLSVRRYLQQDGVDDGSDFQNIIFNLRPAQTDAWLNQHVNYDQWYRYHAIVDAVRHYDVQPNTGEHLKNRAYYFKPSAETPFGQVWVLPWDSDTSWGPNWNAGEGFCKFAIYGPGGNTPRADFIRDYKNVVREIRDLAWTEEQINLLIDSLAAQIADFVPADRDRWTSAPASAGTQNDPPIEDVMADMKKFAFEGGSWVGGSATIMEPISRDTGVSGQEGRDAYLDALADDSLIPSTPQAIATGPSDFPVNRLTFEVANYSGVGAFAAWRWRIAEVTSLSDLPLPPGQNPKFEVMANWESEEILVQNDREITIPSEAVRVGRTYRVRVRAKDVTGRWSHWSPPVEFTSREPESATAMLANLKVTELMFNAPAGSDFDFVELHNASLTEALNVGSAKFTVGIDFTFPRDTMIDAGAYLVLVATTNHQAFRDYYGLDGSVPLLGPYKQSFSNGGEEVTLRTSPGGTDVATFTYQDGRGWPLPADGSGHSLVPLVMGDQADGSLNYGGNWRASTFLLGSPGAADPEPGDVLVINEVAAHTDFPLPPPEDSNDWIELHNTSGSDVTLGVGWYLSDDPSPTNLNQWMIPSDTVIPAGGFVSFDEQTGFHTPFPNGFGLNKAGEQLLLSYLPGNDQDRVVDSLRFKGQESGWTLARYPDGGNDWYAVDNPSRDGANASPPMQVVISELMYRPPDLAGGLDNNLDEFVEIFNPTAFAVDMFNANGTWRLDGGVDYQWPPGITLEPMSRLLVVNFDPADTAQADAFRAVYGLTEPGVMLLGPYGGELANSTERVALEKPQAPDLPGENVSWVIVDEVIYADRIPWSQGADGIGPSLQRLSVLEHGNNPLNWVAALPSPGGSYPGGTAPTITVQPSPESQVVGAGDAVAYTVEATGDGPLLYQWLLNDRAIAGATDQTLLLDFTLPFDSGEYQVVVMNAAGAALSQAVRLRVTTPPKILSQPVGFTVRPGTNVTFSVFASGEGILNFQWTLNGKILPGANQGILTILDVQEEDGGTYIATVTDTNGVVLSEPAKLVVLINPRVIVPPLSQTVVVGDDVTLSVVSGGTLPMSYRWRKASTTLETVTLDSSTAFLNIPNVQLSDAGIYTVVLTNQAFVSPGVLSPRATLTVLADSDGDRMPDAYETDQGFDPEDPTDGDLDGDLDGLTNREEYQVGTDPKDGSSYLRLVSVESDLANTGKVRLTFMAVSNRTYTVLVRNSLGFESWVKLADVPAVGTNRVVEVMDEPFVDARQRFYWLASPRIDEIQP